MMHDDEIRLGMTVLYKGAVPQREPGEFVGFLARLRDADLADVVLLDPGKTWGAAASAFRWMVVPRNALRPFWPRRAIGTVVLFRVRESDHAEAQKATAPTLPSVRYETAIDPETEEARVVARREPGIPSRVSVVRGSRYHQAMTEFTALIVRPYADGTADLALVVPGKNEPTLVRGIREGDGPGEYTVLEEGAFESMSMPAAIEEPEEAPEPAPESPPTAEPAPVRPALQMAAVVSETATGTPFCGVILEEHEFGKLGDAA